MKIIDRVYHCKGRDLTTEDLTKSMTKITEEGLGIGLGTQDWRHFQIGVSRSRILGRGKHQNEVLMTIFDLHSAHSSEVATNTYAVDSASLQFGNSLLLNINLLTSVAWHRVSLPKFPVFHRPGRRFAPSGDRLRQ